ncbi:RluA family pseudouridine synthase [Microbaculum marinisediminis]|uniref:Pseudouridine synthase n=1 Tax=Microbaculum marinisediminis TaxID=2931392 RepID=A0AAW5R6D8_9HYPH|nr:RluA family pseudouridine synthase [Microbaculum sp. A6E488]MCT8974483.1 RluA family pseudouridine synthase [Microbaculum sp. A6E488]
MSGVQRLHVGSDEDGMRLDRWFRHHFPQVTQGYLQKLLRTGQVRVDGARAKAADRLSEGQEIRVPPVPSGDERRPRPKPGLSAADRDFLESITLYEDDDLLILNKPSGIAVQGGTKTTRHIDGLLAGLGEDADTRPRLVHRLDRDTSGVLVVAKKRQAAAKMGRMFQTRSVRKIYWAVVRGLPKPPQGKVDAALIKAATPDGDRVRAARPGEHDEAQKAVTHFSVVDHAAQKFSWMSLKPVTGRQHQLRAHMAMLGHPIIGDDKYGDDRELPDAIENRLHLHARRIAFPHPATGKTVDVTAPLPEHMTRTFAVLGFQVNRVTGDGGED